LWGICMGDVFQFLSSASLEKLTGRKANTLEELLGLIRSCPESSIFYHTFSAFMKMRDVQLPYDSDFAIWADLRLNEKALAERLMAIDLREYNTIKSLRTRLIEIIESHRKQVPESCEKIASEPFYLYDIMRVVYLTDRFAYDLRSFRDILKNISIYSIYFHFIESRLHTELHANDFSTWIEGSLNMADLAHRIRDIDISVYTIEGLRSRIIQLIDEYLKGGNH
jgi:hypothetical protein